MESYIQLGLLVVAIVAVIVSLMELHSHKKKENNKLLSQLNLRYVNTAEIQKVVRYLRENEPDNNEPSAYEIELFLRFFEELAVYLNTGSLKPNDIREFFDFYFERFEKNERGALLKAKIKNEDKKWRYLNIYRKAMGYMV